jgi:hypothetical protein
MGFWSYQVESILCDRRVQRQTRLDGFHSGEAAEATAAPESSQLPS